MKAVVRNEVAIIGLCGGIKSIVVHSGVTQVIAKRES